MREMFASSPFNRPLDHFVVDNVQYFDMMFAGTEAFDQPLSSWNPASADSMIFMFLGATSFSQNLCSWSSVLSGNGQGDVANVTGMFEETACPQQDEPDLLAAVPGPFCVECTGAA